MRVFAGSAAPRRPQPAARTPRRWPILGALLGALAGGLALAPAAWLAEGVARWSEGRLLLADARGSIWSGSAVAALAPGPGAQGAVALPGRLAWRVGIADGGLELRLRQPCCLRGEPRLHASLGIERWRLALLPAAAAVANAVPPAAPAPAPALVGQWPAAWLVGLGTPWNTLQLDGELRLSAQGLQLERSAGRWQLAGSARLELQRAASRLSTLPVLGSYRLQLDAAEAGARIGLSTTSGALQLSGDGSWSAAGLRFRGQAGAAAGALPALQNLLNIIGRRDGERSIISIG